MKPSGELTVSTKAVMDLRPGIEAEMLDLLGGADRAMRLAAVGVLGTLPDDGGLEGLGRALGDEAIEVRLAAVGTLSAFSAVRGIDALCRALDDRAVEVRFAAVAALAALPDARGFDLLCRALGDEAVEVRLAVVGALSVLPDARGLDVLRHALTDAAVEVRLAAVTALGALPDGGDIPGLCSALSDVAEEVRCAAAVALVAGREPRAFMEAMLRDLGPDGSASLRVVVRAAKQFCGTEAWEEFDVEKYCGKRVRDRKTEPALRTAAEALLRELSLVTPTVAPDDQAAVLLRPAGMVASESKLLLRPVQPEEET